MKKTRYLLLALVVIVCFGVVFSASAASQLTAKQIMLDRLQSADFIPTGDINKTSSEVGWVNPDQINITRGGSVINMYINKTGYLVDGVEKQLDAPPFIMGSRTMVPLRFVAQELGCTVEYDGATNTVNIFSN